MKEDREGKEDKGWGRVGVDSWKGEDGLEVDGEGEEEKKRVKERRVRVMVVVKMEGGGW